MKKKAAEKIDEDWMSTYGDMVTLLLCFFVMMPVSYTHLTLPTTSRV